MTPEQLMAIVPGLKAGKAAVVVNALNTEMDKGEINTPLRQAHFIAQLAHESDGFRADQEYASGAEYEGRKDLGNIHPGDGRKYKGHGWIEITGRANHAAAGKALGLDLINHPELACLPENCAKIAVWYWIGHGLNKYADADDIITITKRINGGLNGLDSREAYLDRAYDALGIQTTDRG
jgi:putative chitinase